MPPIPLSELDQSEIKLEVIIIALGARLDWAPLYKAGVFVPASTGVLPPTIPRYWISIAVIYQAFDARIKPVLRNQ